MAKMKELIAALETKMKEGHDPSEIISEMKREARRTRFGLVWENHPEEVEKTLETHVPLLTEQSDLSIMADEADGKGNFLIEGDNLHALIAMKNIGRKVDVIYIDPPYNTGNEFVYNDRIVDKEDSFRHSKWLSFMEKRLILAKELLNDDGVIFVSIDDNEQAHLKMLMDQVFGAENFVANRIIDATPKNDPMLIATSHEYMLVYVKNKGVAKNKKWGSLHPLNTKINKMFDDKILNEKMSFLDFNETLLSFYKNEKLMKDNIANYRYADKNGIYRLGPIDDPQSKGPKDIRYNPITGEQLKTPNSGWRCSLSTWNDWVNSNLIHFPEDNSKLVSKKTYLSSDKLEVGRSVIKMQSRKSTNILKEIFGYKAFDYPKPIDLIKEILLLINNPNAVILDFFAGSGTTGHAVLELNKEDGGNRKFILCTNNEGELDKKTNVINKEDGICRKVTHRRLHNVIKGIRYKNGVEYRVDAVPANVSYMQVELKAKASMQDIQRLKEELLSAMKVRYMQRWYEEIIENTLYRMRDGETCYYLYDNDFVDPDEIRAEGETNIVYVDMHDAADRYLMTHFDEVHAMQSLLGGGWM